MATKMRMRTQCNGDVNSLKVQGNENKTVRGFLSLRQHVCYYLPMTTSMPPSSSSLNDFITHARKKGMDHATIRLLLVSSGWKEKDVIAAMSEESLDMQVPTPPEIGSARDAFLHLLTFTALYSSVISVMMLFFEFVNLLLPDPALGENYYNVNNDSSYIRWLLAVLIVSFPLLAFLWRTLHREFVAHPEKLATGVRRWLTYFTLFVTACALVGDGIALVFSLLQGEWTMRFLLKVIIVAVLAGVPFSYYFSVLRMPPESYRTWPHHKTFALLATALAAVAFVWGIAIVGSPLQGRSERFDEQRTSDLQAIENEIYNEVYGVNRYNTPTVTSLPKPLPKSLDEVQKQVVQQRISITDPETGAPYEYSVSGNTFTLCAVFNEELHQEYNIFWDHSAGRTCYEFNALEPQGK